MGDFHYNGHRLLTEVPGCADAEPSSLGVEPQATNAATVGKLSTVVRTVARRFAGEVIESIVSRGVN